MSRLAVWAALPVLLAIIGIGILFDMIGVAVAVADERPFHALASKRMSGARQSLALIRNADRVSSFCNDVVGDLAGTISGAAAAALVVQMAASLDVRQSILNLLIVASVAALTVGGKAAGKSFAIRRANLVTQWSGQAIAWVERLLRLELIRDPRPARSPRGRARRR